MPGTSRQGTESVPIAGRHRPDRCGTGGKNGQARNPVDQLAVEHRHRDHDTEIRESRQPGFRFHLLRCDAAIFSLFAYHASITGRIRLRKRFDLSHTLGETALLLQ
jgi:hypothetical protein